MSGALRAAILAAADAVEAAREPLCLLDAASGDGDHGVTMTIGARRVRSQLEQVASDEPEALIRAAAIGMAGAGGAIGAIYGRGLLAIAAGLREGPPPAGPDDPAGLELLAEALERAATATSAMGAGPGDKTILDALLPTAASLAESARAGVTWPVALAAADEAAQAGAASTAELEARIGRSARNAGKSRGTVDPGAASLAIIIHALVASVLATAEA
ncbi:MAG TPA: DAK2 domain-containing protein [Candidatus Limnocylindrales bacterium]|nr:DAK2 domain-containing protein [Candidatus Limnocylindrales bacterium]